MAELNGLLLVNKPKGMTSFDVVYKIRKIVGQKSVGHTGTLDPEVDGLLIVVLGKATKLIDRLQTHPKNYSGIGLIGQSSSTEDQHGEIVEEKKLSEAISGNEIQSAMNTFVGEYQQTPPMFSAVKVNGKRLYEYAFKGEVIERPTRSVNIFDFKLTGDTTFENGFETYPFEARVSKGTYIRTLLVDLAEKMGYPGMMSELKRQEADGFSVEDALDLSQYLEGGIDLIKKNLISLNQVLKDMETINLSDQQNNVVINGGFIELDSSSKEVALIYNNQVRAIYQREANYYKPKTMLILN